MRDCKSKKIGCVLLSGIIAIGFFLRTYQLLDRGITHYDEGFYLVRAHELKAKPLFSLPWCGAQPGHISLIATMSVFTGLQDYTPLLISSIFGILTVILIYMLAREMYSNETGLWAGFLIAFSPYHLYYSRSGYAFSSALFFSILGVYLYYLSHVNFVRKNFSNSLLLASGISTGFAITCHHTFFWMWLAFPVYELVLGKKNKLPIKKRLLILICALFLPAMIFEVLVRITNFIIPGTGNDGFAYFPQLRRLFAQFIPAVARVDPGRSSSFRFFDVNSSAVTSYLRFFWRLEGPLVCILFIAGCIVLLKRFRKKFFLNDFLILAQILIPFSIWFGHAWLSNKIRVKALFVFLPGMSIIAGQAIVWLNKKLNPAPRVLFLRRILFTGLIVFFVFTPVIKWVKEVVSVRSYFRNAADELSAYLKDDSPHIATNFSSKYIWQFYFKKHNITNSYVYLDGSTLKDGLFIEDFGTQRTMEDTIVWRSQNITIKKLLSILNVTPAIIDIPYRRDDILEGALEPDFRFNNTLEHLRIYDLRKIDSGIMR